MNLGTSQRANIISGDGFIRLMEHIQVTDAVAIAVNEYGSNLACVTLEDELIFVDAGLLTWYASEFRAAMEDKHGKKASTLLLTHGHIDHFFGMKAFSDCEVIAAEAARSRLEYFWDLEFTEEYAESRSGIFPYLKEAIEDYELRLPTRWIRNKLSIGDVLSFEVIGGHSAGSSVVVSEPLLVCIAGDLVQAERYPYFGEPDTDLGKWVQTLRKWSAMDILHVLPGHGPPVTAAYLQGVAEFFEDLTQKVSELKQRGVSVDEVSTHTELPKGYWPIDVVRNPGYDFSVRNLYESV